jgi:hypothetical protein
MTREQEDRIERIATQAGRVHVNTPYHDGSVEATIPSGECWLISPAGHLKVRPFNHSVKWSYA